MKIKLTNGKYAIVDKVDLYKVSEYSWKAERSRNTWYAKRNKYIGGKWVTYSMHRIIMKAPQGVKVDHINGNGLDNRKENLRFCNDSQNRMNSRKVRNSHSPYKGICWHKASKHWIAQIKKDGTNVQLGFFRSARSAARAYDGVARLIFGSYAKTNFRL